MHLLNFVVVAVLSGAGLAFPLEGLSDIAPSALSTYPGPQTVTVLPASCTLPISGTFIKPSTTYTNLSVTPTTEPATDVPGPAAFTTFFTHPDTSSVTTFTTHPDTTTPPASAFDPFTTLDVVTITATACPFTGHASPPPTVSITVVTSVPPSTVTEPCQSEFSTCILSTPTAA